MGRETKLLQYLGLISSSAHNELAGANMKYNLTIQKIARRKWTMIGDVPLQFHRKITENQLSEYIIPVFTSKTALIDYIVAVINSEKEEGDNNG